MQKNNNDSLYVILRQRSLEDVEMARMAMECEFYDSAMERCHFALEKIMKAAIIKAGGRPPSKGPAGHNLLKLANVKINNRKFIHSAIISQRTILVSWHKIHSRWNTDLRYSSMDLHPLDYDDLYESYKRVYQWIRVTYVD